MPIAKIGGMRLIIRQLNHMFFWKNGISRFIYDTYVPDKHTRVAVPDSDPVCLFVSQILR